MMPVFPYRFVCYVVVSFSFLLGVAAAETFKNPQIVTTSSDPTGVATADFNHDGHPDIAYVDGTSTLTLHILLGNGDGTFTHGQDIDLPKGICGYHSCLINLADVTNDGIIDVIMGGSAGSDQANLAVFAGKGDGTFQAPVISTVNHNGQNGGNPSLNWHMGVGDVNGDGAADLVIADANSATLFVLLGNNTGSFSLSRAFTYYFTNLAVAYLFDVNGDGNLDIIVNDLVGAQTYVLLGSGNGSFGKATVYVSYAILFADMDGDGHPDLIASVFPGQIEVLKGNPDGTFGTPSVVATVPLNVQLVGAGDFNGDGIPDLVFLTPAGVGILLGQGNLTYGSLITSVAGTSGTVFYQPSELALADFNGDGHNDMAMGVDGGLLVLAGNGDGTFISADSYDFGKTIGTVSVADFNGDRLPT